MFWFTHTYIFCLFRLFNTKIIFSTETLESAKKREDLSFYQSATQAESSDDSIDYDIDENQFHPSKQVSKRMSEKTLRPEINSQISSHHPEDQTYESENKIIHELLSKLNDNFCSLNRNVENLNSKTSNLNQSVQEALTDIYKELYAIKKNLSNISSAKSTKISAIECYEHFPLKDHQEFEELNRQLENEKFFTEMQTKISNHVKSLDDVGETLRDFFKKLLPIVFHKSYISSITWVDYEGKKAISGTKVVDLLQSMFIKFLCT